MLLLNKADLADSWDISEDAFATLESDGWRIIRTSAKSGHGVEEAFQELAKRLLA